MIDPEKQLSKSSQSSHVIISEFPSIFERFKEKSFVLLWRGSKDGFNARQFHQRCDGHRNTLTIIEDIRGNIFGGFTPIAWKSRSRSPYEIADESLQSFIFTFRNPQHTQPIIFPLRADKFKQAIFSRDSFGPRFGVSDILISSDCDSQKCQTRDFGHTYDVNFNVQLTKFGYFIVKEIEIFEIQD
jgi:hypothetical protein